MTNKLITELIAAIVAARADGDGVLTIAAVRARLGAAKLRVIREENSDTDSVAAAFSRALRRKRSRGPNCCGRARLVVPAR
jgi:hypothetical protein